MYGNAYTSSVVSKPLMCAFKMNIIPRPKEAIYIQGILKEFQRVWRICSSICDARKNIWCRRTVTPPPPDPRTKNEIKPYGCSQSLD
mmetsp:Transcript_1014/g.1628  ORF Transcript_1014/g.1628 Transcript_1014/m.1628 type:complete len:87 (-) Transcript_1014:145-405(-)